MKKFVITIHQVFFEVLIISLIIFFAPLKAFSENEPNNSIESANILALNGSISGSFSALDYSSDYFKLTTLSDGKLTIQVTSDAGLCVSINVLNETGFLNLYNNGSCGTGNYSNTITINNLATGTYYIWAGNSGNGNYNISNTFIAVASPNDTEPNNEIATALSISTNSQKSGHLGYRNVQTDESDYYKITTTVDGKLSINLTSENSLCINLSIYNETGFYNLYNNGLCPNTNHTNSLVINNLAAGTYIIRADAVGYGTYTISNTLEPTLLANDAEPNNSSESAGTLSQNGKVTGHLGYRNIQTDDYDYYKIVTTGDGKLSINLATDNSLCINLSIYNENGFYNLYNNGYCPNTNHSNSLVINNLAAGTYIIRADAVGYGSYTISNILEPTLLANDTEPNNSIESAGTLGQNGEVTGHLGYRYIQTDDYDYYKIVTTGNINLTTNVSSDPTLCVNMRLLNNLGGLILITNGSCGNSNHSDSMVKNSLAAGTYYLEVGAVGYGSYRIKNSYNYITGLDLLNISSENNLIIYPNPAKNELSISAKNVSKEEIKIYNINGLLQIPAGVKVSDKFCTIDISNFSSGMYFIELKQDGKTLNSKFIKE